MFNTADSSKVIHFIGIGGIGVSGLAEIMLSMGYAIQGSDQQRSSNVERLEKLGVKVFIGHQASNIGKADIVVFSSAISSNNPEIKFAKEHRIPLLSRSEMLSQIMRFKKSVVVSGSHGKTTVTSICAAILEMASFNPTVVNGGIINSYQTNAKLGKGEWAVIESDESDGSFINFFPVIGVITNIDKEHINHYGSFENLKEAFSRFIRNTPFYGCCLVCFDDQAAYELSSKIFDRRIISYGIENEEVSYRAVNVVYSEKGATFEVLVNGADLLKGFSIPLFGTHNVLNSMAGIAMALELGIDPEIIKSALAGLAGVNRRFTLVGSLKGIKFIDDYAHHPTEIQSVLDSAKQAGKGKVVIVCQPHRFVRLTNLFPEFVEILAKPDIRIITEVYKVTPKEPWMKDSTDLFQALQEVPNSFYATDQQAIKEQLVKLIEEGQIAPGDIILFTGAGSISKWAREIFEELQELS